MVILFLGSAWAPVAGDPLAYFSGPLSGGESGLLRMDLADGDVTEIGPFGPGVGANALAFAPDGTLYGIGLDLAGGGQLVAIDPATGAATLVAELSLTDPFNLFDSMTADACGRLFAGGLMGVFGGGLRQAIVEVDPAVGTLHEVFAAPDGPVGLAASGETLFTVRQGVLSRLDPATGVITPIAGTTVPALDYDFAADGFLWAATALDPAPLPEPWGHTFRLDPQTGEFEVLAENHRSMYGGIAIAPPPGACGAATPLAIPELSPLGLAVLAILLAVSGVLLAGTRCR